MLRWRLTLGAVLIAGLIALCWLDAQAAMPGVWLLPLALVAALLASHEVLSLLAARGLRPAAWVVYLGNLALVLSNYVPLLWPRAPLEPLGWPLAAFGLGIVLAFVAEMARYERPGEAMERLGLTVFSLAYVGLLLSFVCQLRMLGDPPGRLGIAALASLVIVVKMCDTGAYTFGRLFGRHKLAPTLSPGKTIEGAAGGIASACLGAWFALEWLTPRLVQPAVGGAASGGLEAGWLAFGVVVGVTGMLGDLAESLIKRDLGRKDSSTWMPGFGGVLDLLDSILYAAPIAYLCWALGLVGG